MENNPVLLSAIQGALIGLAVGDALGVPVEFSSPVALRTNPVTDMRGYGTHDQPPGTWSDDASMTFCLAESIAAGFDLQNLANRFINWYDWGYWTPHGSVFDIGITTQKAIINSKQGVPINMAGLADEFSNGNGSLMRIIPLVFWLNDKPLEQRIEYTRQVSALTHRHIRSITACVLYIEFAHLLLNGHEKTDAYQHLKKQSTELFRLLILPKQEAAHFNRILDYDITKVTEKDIRGSGYVIHSLEASLWAFLTTENYQEAVLKGINLGEDTDTTGAIVGGLAGLYYRYQGIPQNWIIQLARKTDILELAERFYKSDSIS